MVIVMATEAEQAQVTKRYMVTMGMTNQSQILRMRGSWNMHLFDLLLCNMCLKNRNCHLITERSGNAACIISKGPVTDVMFSSGEEVALQPSAGKRHVD